MKSPWYLLAVVDAQQLNLSQKHYNHVPFVESVGSSSRLRRKIERAMSKKRQAIRNQTAGLFSECNLITKTFRNERIQAYSRTGLSTLQHEPIATASVLSLQKAALRDDDHRASSDALFTELATNELLTFMRQHLLVYLDPEAFLRPFPDVLQRQLIRELHAEW